MSFLLKEINLNKLNRLSHNLTRYCLIYRIKGGRLIKFKERLIQNLKEHPGLYNEIRAELITSRLIRDTEKKEVNYVDDPQQDKLLDQINDQQLIDSIIINLNYFIEYEREMREGDL